MRYISNALVKQMDKVFVSICVSDVHGLTNF